MDGGYDRSGDGHEGLGREALRFEVLLTANRNDLAANARRSVMADLPFC